MSFLGLVSEVAEQYDWKTDALCRLHPEVDWFDDFGKPTDDNIVAAKEVCAECPVQEECLDFALRNREAYNIWGGLTPRERRKLSRGKIKK